MSAREERVRAAIEAMLREPRWAALRERTAESGPLHVRLADWAIQSGAASEQHGGALIAELGSAEARAALAELRRRTYRMEVQS